MRYLLITLLFSFLAGPVFAQERVIRDFIQEHRRGDENFAIKVPGWMIEMTGNIGLLAAEDTEEKAAFRLAKELGTARVLTYVTDEFPAHKQVENLLYSLENYHGYERWGSVRSQQGEDIQISVRYRKEKIDQLIVAVREQDRTHFISARADLDARELGRLIEDLL